ncbi:MAG: PocR ligand-binding domain-containing protein [Anaerolineaceae bacterium]|jgi:excisionase family DNA binding protein
MPDYLTTRQVQEILKVDRITIYRMVQDGRLKGVKIGRQWRFAQREVEYLLRRQTGPDKPAPTGRDATFPTHCIQTIQDLFANISRISALVVNRQGEAQTEVSRSCSFCRSMLSSASGAAACRASWKAAAEHVDGGGKYFTCHAGLQYMAAPLTDKGEAAGLFLCGQFYWQAPDAREQSERIRRLATAHNLDAKTLHKAAAEIPVIDPQQQSQMDDWPVSAARAIQSILQERILFIDRLQQIAHLTQLK